MPYIESDISGQVYYRKSGSGPVLVLIHGFPRDGSLWDNIGPALSDSFTVIIPDLPGSGKSDLKNDTTSVESLSESIYAILENEQVTKAVIIGHSMGGYVALAFADKYPDRLAGLALVHATAAADDEVKKEIRRKSVKVIEKGGREIFIRQMVPNLFADQYVTGHPIEVDEAIAGSLKLSSDSIIAYYDAMRDRPDRTDVFSNIKIPVQFILGREDNILPFMSVLNQCIISNRTFVSVYNDCGHMSMIEDPQKLIEDLSRFSCYCYDVQYDEI